MAASPISFPASVPSSSVRRRPLALTQRRLEANRRNAARSTGPRTPEGKARVARNPIKHGFFVAQERWTPAQHRDFEQTLKGLRDDLKPQGMVEESCVLTIAQSYVRMAAMLRYENIAALKYHQQRERELNDRIASADAREAQRLRAGRDKLRRAGLWHPTIPGPREAQAIIRYGGSLDRTIRRASSCLEGLKSLRIGGFSRGSKLQKQTHYSGPPSNGPEAAEGPRMSRCSGAKMQKQTHYSASPNSGPEPGEGPRVAPSRISENAKTNRSEASPNSVLRLGEGPQMATSSKAQNAKTNPLTSMFTGNRHARRRAKALAAREQRSRF
jgi:hypothetical protein